MSSCADKTKLKVKQIGEYVSRDRFCFEIFISQIFLLFFIAVYVVETGSPARVSKAFDPDHNACGVDLGYENFPFIYFVTPDKDHLFRTLCVEKCPVIKFKPDDTKYLNCRPNSLVRSCNRNPSIFNVSNQVAYYDTFPFKDNVCIPSNLQYYNEMAKQLLPVPQHRLVHDLYHTELEVILLGSLVAFLLTISLMQLIDDYYQQVMWTFLIGTIACIAFAGILFFRLAIKSHSIDATPHPAVTSFEVTEDYILQTANNSSPLTNLILGIIFVSFLFISTYELYQKFGDVKLLLMMLRLTGDFMKDKQNKKLKQFSFIMFVFFVLIFAMNYHLIIYLLSAMKVNTEDNQYPFTQVQPATLQFILLPILLFSALWQNSFLISCLEYVTVASISKWFTGLVEVQSQSDFDKADHVKSAVSDLITKLPQLTKASFYMLVFSIPKTVTDLILDSIEDMKNGTRKTQLKSLFRWLDVIYQETLRSVETVMYVEISKHDCSVNEARDKLKENLKDPEIQNEFEKYGNLGALFNTSGRVFIMILLFAFSQICLAQIPRYFVLLYSPKGITIVCLFLAFSVSSLYLSIYGLCGQTLLYLVLQQRKDMSQQDQMIFKDKLKKVFPAMYDYVIFAEEERKLKEQQYNLV